MNILVDYENVNVAGLDGIEELTDKDQVEIFYSDKNSKMDIGMVELIHNSACSFKMKKMEKTAPNYLDFHLVCRASQLLNSVNMLAIISKDKGYISAHDFYEKEGKQIFLSESIRECLKQNHFEDAVPESVNEEKKEIKKEEPAVTPIAVIETTNSSSTKSKVITAPEAETAIESSKKRRVSQLKKLTEDEKKELKEVLKDLPKHNGKLQQSVIDCFNECSTLGQIRYKLVSDVGRNDGEKAYKLIETRFAEFKNIKVE